MNVDSINTTNQILNAFSLCNKNPTEEAKLFDSLLCRYNPPVEALINLLTETKIEPILVLTIQTLGKINYSSIKTKFRKNQQLLKNLCHLAQWGATDLIRWSAAMAIKEICFKQSEVRKHLSKEPSLIANEILQYRKNKQGKIANDSVNFGDYFEAIEQLRKSLSNWKCVKTLPARSGWVLSLAFSCDGKFLASGNEWGTIEIWNASTWQEIQTLSPKNGEVGAVTFTPDCLKLVSGHNSVITIWELATGQQLHRLFAHSGSINSLAVSPDGLRLASGGVDGTVKLWQLSTGEEICTFYGHGESVQSVIFSPDGQRLISGGADIRVWEAASRGKKLLNFITGHSGLVRSVAISPDGQTLASCGLTIKLWDVNIWEKYIALNSASEEEDEEEEYSYKSDRFPEEYATLMKHWTGVLCVAFSPDGETLASGSGDTTIKIWEVGTGQPIDTLTEHSDQVNCISFSPDGQTLASGSDDGTIKIWRHD